MVTYVLMIPELNFGVIVLTNQMEGLAFVAIANQIKMVISARPERTGWQIYRQPVRNIARTGQDCNRYEIGEYDRIRLKSQATITLI
jgi:hypothetical protein